MATKNVMLTVTQISEQYGRSRMYVSKLVNDGKIPAQKIVTETNQTIWKAKKEDVDTYFANVKSGGTNAEGNNAYLCYGKPERIAELAKANPDVIFYKKPTHAHPEKRPVLG